MARQTLKSKKVAHSYFDHNATTPVAAEVLRAHVSTLAEVYGNASSIHHFGQAAKKRLECARRQLAQLIDCDPIEIVFTSGGTESDNLAIFGLARRRPSHVIASTIEHPAVLNACAQLQREGTEVTWLPVSGSGSIDPDSVRRALRPDTSLITAMHANNETGVLQPVKEIAAIAREAAVPFHTDAVQTAGRIPISVRELGVDLLSLSGHKFGGLKGTGALYVRKGVTITPQIYGGHHERDRRAGTENVPGIAALGVAAQSCGNWTRITELRDRLQTGILSAVSSAHVNGRSEPRLPNTTNIRFDGIGGEAMVIALDLRGYSVSSGSACSSGAVEPSHVLLAMGQTREQARSSVRFSLGPSNTEEQVDGLIEAVAGSVAHLRRISPSFRSNGVMAHAR